MSEEPRFFEVETDGPIVIWKFHNPPQNLWNVDTNSELFGIVKEF